MLQFRDFPALFNLNLISVKIRAKDLGHGPYSKEASLLRKAHCNFADLVENSGIASVNTGNFIFRRKSSQGSIKLLQGFVFLMNLEKAALYRTILSDETIRV